MAAGTALGDLFQTAHCIVKLAGVEPPFDKVDIRCGRERFDQPLLFPGAAVKLFFGINVRIIVEHCNLEIFAEVFKYIAAAGCAAAVQKKRRTRLIRNAGEHALQLFLIISVCLIHIATPFGTVFLFPVSAYQYSAGAGARQDGAG